MEAAFNTVPGFSLTNRCLLYTSLLLTPAQAISGLGSHCLSNLGFIAFNCYQQYIWYTAVTERKLHALALLPVHLDVIYVFTYLGGVPSGNTILFFLQVLGTIGLLVMNSVACWISHKTNLPEGVGIYRFFFFGWRTLSDGWMRFFFWWAIGDVVMTGVCIGALLYGASKLWEDHTTPLPTAHAKTDNKVTGMWIPAVSVLIGPFAILLSTWPLIMWVELIVKGNDIVSETDMVSVYLFIVQSALLVVSSVANYFS